MSLDQFSWHCSSFRNDTASTGAKHTVEAVWRALARPVDLPKQKHRKPIRFRIPHWSSRIGSILPIDDPPHLHLNNEQDALGRQQVALSGVGGDPSVT